MSMIFSNINIPLHRTSFQELKIDDKTTTERGSDCLHMLKQTRTKYGGPAIGGLCRTSEVNNLCNTPLCLCPADLFVRPPAPARARRPHPPACARPHLSDPLAMLATPPCIQLLEINLKSCANILKRNQMARNFTMFILGDAI